MKTTSSLLPTAALWLAGFIAQPAAVMAQDQPHLNPATGLPVSTGPGGQPTAPPPDLVVAPNSDGLSPDPTGSIAALKTAQDVRALIAAGQYDAALHQCLAFQSALKGDRTVAPLVADWIELGRRFPIAREALVQMRDHDLSEFSAGRGYAVLFSEIKAINTGLSEDEATYALFKTIQEKDHSLAAQCYGDVEDLLMQKGEYTLCLAYLGDPQARFNTVLDEFQLQIALQQRQEQFQKQMQQRQAEMARQNHWSAPLGVGNFPLPDLARGTTNHFVNQVIKLEQILVGADRKVDAEIVRDQALALMDDPRLKGAISDAVANFQSHPAATAASPTK